jgi:3-hydroxyethyl bacteriochlorophyllide a dehydrogenase
MDAIAVILEKPEDLRLGPVDLAEPGDDDVVVDISFSGISTGTERLLWTGRMPPFPGMGYPLVPGYESVGRVASVGARATRRVGETVFVPGSRGFKTVRGLFGGAASRVVVADQRVLPIDESLGEQGVLIALAATAHHAIARSTAGIPDLIVGHGVLGRLVARVAVALGAAPTVWETNALRRDASDYAVVAPDDDPRKDYRAICDVSGDPAILDRLVARLAPGGEIVLAGFYEVPLAFAFPPAFMKEARFSIAAEFRAADMEAVRALIAEGRLSLDGLVTHRAAATDAARAYRTAFGDPSCLKMVLDWRHAA